MQIEVYFQDELLGTAMTVDGRVVLSGKLEELFAKTTLGPPGARVTVDDGDEFIRAMIGESNNGYMRTETIGEPRTQVVISDGQDPLKAAAAISGLSMDELEKYRGMSADQVRAERMRLAAERVRRGVSA